MLSIGDTTDIDFRNAEIKPVTLKQKQKGRRAPTRIVPVPSNLIGEIASYIAIYIETRARSSSLLRSKFYEQAKIAGTPKELGHPHTLRHSRAIEFLKAGVYNCAGSIGSCLSDYYSHITEDIRPGGKEHT